MHDGGGGRCGEKRERGRRLRCDVERRVTKFSRAGLLQRVESNSAYPGMLKLIVRRAGNGLPPHTMHRARLLDHPFDVRLGSDILQYTAFFFVSSALYWHFYF